MTKIKLKSGRDIDIKSPSLDDRDIMLDSVEYVYDDKGNVGGVKMMHSTITKWLRLGLNGQANDDSFGILTKKAVYTNVALSEGDMMMLDVSVKAVDNGSNELLVIDIT